MHANTCMHTHTHARTHARTHTHAFSYCKIKFRVQVQAHDQSIHNEKMVVVSLKSSPQTQVFFLFSIFPRHYLVLHRWPANERPHPIKRVPQTGCIFLSSWWYLHCSTEMRDWGREVGNEMEGLTEREKDREGERGTFNTTVQNSGQTRATTTGS